MGNLFGMANEYLSRLSRPFLITATFMLLLFVGFVDYATGTELNVSIFYLIPISLQKKENSAEFFPEKAHEQFNPEKWNRDVSQLGVYTRNGYFSNFGLCFMVIIPD